VKQSKPDRYPREKMGAKAHRLKKLASKRKSRGLDRMAHMYYAQAAAARGLEWTDK